MDNIIGAATDDMIDGSRAVTVAGVLDTLNNADSIDGGAGTDTLFCPALYKAKFSLGQEIN